MSYIIFSLYRNGVDSMNQTPEVTGFDLPQSPKSTPETPNVLPGYHKCLSCMDYGVSCNGPNLVALGDIGAVRTFHKVMKRSRKLSLKAIADAAPTISDSTINEYFSNTAKDYKWTTVGAIDNAITAICGNRIGLPPLDQSCPAASSEVRQQIAAADLKVAAAELKQAQAESECEDLRRRLSDSDGDHTTKLTELAAAKQGEIDWLKTEVRVWRRFACILLIVGLVILGTLMLSLLIHVV